MALYHRHLRQSNMENVIPETSEPKVGLGESIYHAQVIVEAFSKGLEEKQCMSRIPVAAYSEAELLEERLRETLAGFDIDEKYSDVLEPITVFTYTVPGETEVTDVPEKTEEEKNEAAEAKRDWLDECYNCNAEEPSLDLDSIFGSLLKRIEDFIDNIKAMFNPDYGNYCQFIHLLSFMCIPDLIAILALLLALILKLLAGILLTAFSLMAFIMGLISTVIAALLKFVLAMIMYALTPISCLLDTLSQIYQAIPTQDNLANQLSEDQYELLYGEKPSDEDKAGPNDKIKSSLDQVKTIQSGDSLKKTFKSIESSIEKASQSVNDTIDDMFGLVAYLDCEPKRSGTDIFSYVGEVVKLYQLINLITAVIDKKASGSDKELCKNTVGKSSKEEDKTSDTASETDDDNDTVQDLGLTNEEIAEIIQEALGVDTSIVTDENGEDIGVILKNNVEYQTRLNFYSCDINDIIKEYEIGAIIDRATAIPETNLFGDGQGVPSTLNVSKVSIRDIGTYADGGEYTFFKFDEVIGEEESVSDVVNDIISFKARASQNSKRIIPEGVPVGNTVTDIVSNLELISASGSSIVSLDNQISGIKKPDTNVVQSDYSLGIEVNSAIPSSVFTNSTQLKCGSIDDIEKQFALFEDNK